MKKKGVAILLWHPDAPYNGGSFNSHQNSFTYQLDCEYKWFIIDKSGSNFEQIKNDNFNFQLYKIPREILFLVKKVFLIGRPIEWLYSSIKIFFNTRNLIKTRQIDVVYVPIAEFFFISLTAYLLKKIYNIKLVAIIHQVGEIDGSRFFKYLMNLVKRGVPYSNVAMQSIYVWFMFFCFKSLFQKFDKLGAISECSAKIFSKLFCNRFEFFEYGFDYSQINRLESTEKKYDAVFLARLVYSKGIDDLIIVWAEVVKKDASKKLLIIGDGEQYFVKAILNKINLLGLAGNIFLVGRKEGAEKFKLLMASRLFLYLSYLESYAQVIDEAIVCGLPVVAYDLDVYYSRMKYSDAIFLFKKGDINSVIDKVRMILNQPDNYINSVNVLFPTWREFSVAEKKFIFD